ncbi:MAG TPA: bifunctional alpha/beta hydrolase/class I SAM-dependent methyltransferase [Chthoniobacterales bacterium]|nr:bifunctional alpha/beta hydrolase/class I SAM-dependent methyltransferase [Chthoniobacterales bacterium]
MIPSEQHLTSLDGTRLFYRAWIPPGPVNQALLLFHRGHEHSGRWQETVEALNLPDVAVFAWDARGHGRSPGERGAANNLGEVIKDTDAFVRHLSGHHDIPIENMIVLAHSLAAVTVSAWVHDYAPPIRAMVLATAAFQVKLYVPLAIPALRMRQQFLGPGKVTSYVKSGLLTRDRTEAARYDADPLIFKQIAVNVLLDLHDTANRLVADAGAINTPALMIGAGKDWIVRLNAQRRFFERLSSPVKEFEFYPSARHAIFHDVNRSTVVERIRRFVQERFAQTAPVPSLLNADQAGYTHNEFNRLSSGKGVRFALARAGLKAAGHLSRGVEIGWRSGFDSGLSLDYVYENKPRGRTPLGRLIDKSYLNSIGWRGIRQRKINLKRALTTAILRLSDERRPVRILDIAAGAGRYVIETMHELRHIPARAVLRDYRQENIAAAQALAGEFGLTNITVIRGDAFDADSIKSTSPKATIGLISGLYELFPSNPEVLTSLRAVADAMEPGGLLIYTNQPWHPQVEFIARVLRNRENRPWIMRRRTTAEMDELIRTAGFTKRSMEVDQWGMFTVSVAQRDNK